MKKPSLYIYAAVMAIVLVGIVPPKVYAVERPQAENVFGLSGIMESTAIAVWVPIGTGEVVSGVEWYQNDGVVVFPEILAVAGFAQWPSAIEAATVLATNVGGGTQTWSEVGFSQRIVSETGGIYVIFRIPKGSEFQYRGMGGGFGFGYYQGDGVRRGWITNDGENWHPIKPNKQMAIRAVMATDKSAGPILELRDPRISVLRNENSVPAVNHEFELFAYPNPFNPTTTIEYSLVESSHVTLKVFDIRGLLVAELVNEALSAGSHNAQWDGRTQQQGGVASGVYFAKLKAGSRELTARLVLIK